MVKAIRLPSLQFRLSRRVRSMLEGVHPSWKIGSGDRFTDFKPYEQGDPLRRIDWRYLGRTDRLVVRRYEQPKQLRIAVLVDQSQSVLEPFSRGGRREVVEETVSALATLARATGDLLTVIPFSWPLQDRILHNLIESQVELILVLSDFWEGSPVIRSMWKTLGQRRTRWQVRAVGFLRQDETIEAPPLGEALLDPDHQSETWFADATSWRRAHGRLERHNLQVRELAVEAGIRLAWFKVEDPLPAILWLIDPVRFPVGL